MKIYRKLRSASLLLLGVIAVSTTHAAPIPLIDPGLTNGGTPYTPVDGGWTDHLGGPVTFMVWGGPTAPGGEKTSTHYNATNMDIWRSGPSTNPPNTLFKFNDTNHVDLHSATALVSDTIYTVTLNIGIPANFSTFSGSTFSLGSFNTAISGVFILATRVVESSELTPDAANGVVGGFSLNYTSPTDISAITGNLFVRMANTTATGFTDYDNLAIDAIAVPEPSTYGMLAAAGALAFVSRRRRLA